MKLPLHIFEERYKMMIRECQDRDIDFGVVYYDGIHIHNMGCTATILAIDKLYGDGRMDIITQGQSRFVIKDVDQSKAYLQANVLIFEDEYEKESDNDATLVTEISRLIKDLDQISETHLDHDTMADLDIKRLSFLIPSTEVFSPEERQQFLKITSPRLRLIKFKAIMETVIQRMGLNLKIQKIIGGNGDIKEWVSKSKRTT